ncbi:SfnB family sulfur acquisition oxidoreductase [Rhizobium leguminosarum]|uniref:Acyl-CoA dehydrogenase type 2 domain protein n=1 Tax=Rhizobium leguminosarum bv. trifolii (strain WSM1325) TaxID=395491 RepID=C6B9N3_RHILS|nr:SfnB family sulfur acquisition oxidoreductase [Rhizobium leguminosarum]ACS60905.1 Acyl-CoA dehydrogenase type 2 domain protein [Rhizobium leguminosarum bv. trifolii WSM1325]MBY2910256.1 SfnB family sulfur acquisition oxidoreductase [Rhizobium leguminosarum]MBY2918571.1 SfnB family sulfur acquisition oxidoreductase [Rhizobium leguminosarum]MBY2950624.1 SfnB family sulfur acquisition oxidoreductase [Rhizobium leguminosarum]MBY2974057.1 SfnB family sulfur acquisition oxidoreductase [Rhizobium 
MNTVLRQADQIRPVADRIGSDDEAIATARRLAAQFAARAAERDAERILPFGELDLLAQSGLLAITVPAQYGGLDVSNAVLAEVTAILSEADGSIGQIPQNHFYILEALRTDGGEEQQRYFFGRVLAGDRFGNALSERGTKTVGHYNTRITRDGPGYRINGRKFYSTGVLFADWITIFALDPEDRLTMAFVPKGTEGVEIVDDWDGFGQRTTGSGTTILDNVYVSADSVVFHHKGFERPTTIGSVGQIIHAGVDLGIARAAFAETLEFVRTKSRPWMDSGLERAADDPLTIAKVGQIAIRLEAATALVERAGHKVDAAQVETTEEKVIAATLAVAAAKVLTTEVALEASNTLFELAGTSSVQTGLNLDRHWRNARTHTLHDPVRWKYHVVGNYHLNGVTPPKNGAL